MIKPETIICNKCGVEKKFTTEFFHTHKSSTFQLAKICIECQHKAKKIHYSNNKDKYLQRNRRWELSNQSVGKCIKCSQLRMSTSNSFCEKHFLHGVSHKALGTKRGWRLLLDLLKNQNYKCYYTGLDLILGDNASIDHTQPQIKYPELKNELSNLRWTDLRVNRMKREMSEEEFFNLCKLVVNKQIALAGEAQLAE